MFLVWVICLCKLVRYLFQVLARNLASGTLDLCAVKFKFALALVKAAKSNYSFNLVFCESSCRRFDRETFEIMKCIWISL